MPTDEILLPVCDDTEIWRYMDLSRFIAILSSRHLWFSKASAFRDDPWEGYCDVKMRQAPNDEYGPRPLSPQLTGGKPVDDMSWERLAFELSNIPAEHFRNTRDHIFVNSWCLGEESMAMWEIYGSSGRGIAIKSSVGQYRAALQKVPVRPEEFESGKVQYHTDLTIVQELKKDLTSGPIPMPGPDLWAAIVKLAFYKRSCFKHESEWRAALYQNQQPPECPGVILPFDLDRLITAVYIGPRSEPFLGTVVASLIEKYGPNKPLFQSALLSSPEQGLAASTQ